MKNSTKLTILIALVILFLVGVFFLNSFETIPPVRGVVTNALTGEALADINVTRIIFVNEGYRPYKMLRYLSPIGYYGGYHNLKETELSVKTDNKGQFKFDTYRIFHFPFLDSVEKKDALYANIKIDSDIDLVDYAYSGVLSYPSALSLSGHSIMSFPEKEKNFVNKIDDHFLIDNESIMMRLYPVVGSLDVCNGDLFCINFNQYNFLCNNKLFSICENNSYEKDENVKDHCYFLSAILRQNQIDCKKINNKRYSENCMSVFEMPGSYEVKNYIFNTLGYVPNVFLDSCKKASADAMKNIEQKIVYRNGAENIYFNLTFPLAWSDYTRKKSTLIGGVYSISFGFPSQDSLFNIDVYTKSQWLQIEKQKGESTSIYLGESSQYVFGYLVTKNTPVNDMIKARMSEIQDIIKTFKITETY